MSAEIPGCSRCGRCCEMLTIEELDKPPGVPCKFLRRERGLAICTIYDDPRRPEVCAKYNCNGRAAMFDEIQDGLAAGALAGWKTDVEKIKQLVRSGGLNYDSPLLGSLRTSTEPNAEILKALKEMVWPSSRIPDLREGCPEDVLSMIGMGTFLSNLAKEGARKLGVYIDSMLSGMAIMSLYREDQGQLWQQAVDFVNRGLTNPRLVSGLNYYMQGNVNLSPREWGILSAVGGRRISYPAPGFVQALGNTIYGRVS